MPSLVETKQEWQRVAVLAEWMDKVSLTWTRPWCYLISDLCRSSCSGFISRKSVLTGQTLHSQQSVRSLRAEAKSPYQPRGEKGLFNRAAGQTEEVVSLQSLQKSHLAKINKKRTQCRGQHTVSLVCRRWFNVCSVKTKKNLRDEYQKYKVKCGYRFWESNSFFFCCSQETKSLEIPHSHFMCLNMCAALTAWALLVSVLQQIVNLQQRFFAKNLDLDHHRCVGLGWGDNMAQKS